MNKIFLLLQLKICRIVGLFELCKLLLVQLLRVIHIDACQARWVVLVVDPQIEGTFALVSIVLVQSEELRSQGVTKNNCSCCKCAECTDKSCNSVGSSKRCLRVKCADSAHWSYLLKIRAPVIVPTVRAERIVKFSSFLFVLK